MLYPLLEFKGGEYYMPKNKSSKMVKAGAITYFFDIKETKTKKPYLLITESRFKGEGKDRERKTIILFSESAQEFSKALSEMVAKLG